MRRPASPGYREAPNEESGSVAQRRRLTMSDATTSQEAPVTVGLDLGDRHTQVCVLDQAGELIEEARVATRPQALRHRFSGLTPLRVSCSRPAPTLPG